MNTRQFSESGDFRGVMTELPRLKELGVDVIWFMPIYPIGEERRKGSLGSYYSIRDYNAVNPEFGTMEDFKEMVRKIHELDMKVILDWVPNHTSRDAVWISEHPNWYKWDEATGEIETPWDWTDTAQLDYDNPQMRRGMIESMRFWLMNAGVDGFRVDMAMLEPIDFWNDAIPDLMKTREDIFMLAEAEGPEFHRVAFDASYGWETHHLLVSIAQGKTDAPARVLRDKLMELSEKYPTDAYLLNFTSNHDENSWSGSEFERLGAAVRTMAGLTYILPGMPLIYSGQEAGSDKKLLFFEKDLIDWSGLKKGDRQSWNGFYRELNTLRHEHPALWGGEQGGDLYEISCSLPDRVFAVKRKVEDRVVIGLFNLSGEHADLEFYDEDFNGEYHEVGTDKPAQLQSGAHFWIPPWGFFIYHK